MKFKTYVEGLNKFLEKNPEYSELEVVTSSDDEGKSYNPVYFSPCAGQYDPYSSELETSGNGDYVDPRNINAVCVN